MGLGDTTVHSSIQVHVFVTSAHTHQNYAVVSIHGTDDSEYIGNERSCSKRARSTP